MFNSPCVTHLLHTEGFDLVKTKEWEEMGRNSGKEIMILGTLLGNPDESRSWRQVTGWKTYYLLALHSQLRGTVVLQDWVSHARRNCGFHCLIWDVFLCFNSTNRSVNSWVRGWNSIVFGDPQTLSWVEEKVLFFVSDGGLGWSMLCIMTMIQKLGTQP